MKRFEFGQNWSQFLKVLDDQRIVRAERTLKEMLGVTDLHGKRFLDIGSGSGLFSLAARRLGASVIRSTMIHNPLHVLMNLGNGIFLMITSGSLNKVLY